MPQFNPPPPPDPGIDSNDVAYQVTFDGGLPKVEGSQFIGPWVISIWDAIVINRVALPLKHGSLDAGTKLEIDKKKAKGADFPRVVGRGYDARHTKFTLQLWLDVATKANWLGVYNAYVKDDLMPRALDKRFAVEVYHPALAAEGITSLVITERSIMKEVGKQIWEVQVEGIDTRYAVFDQTPSKKGSKPVKKKPATTTNVLNEDTPPALALCLAMQNADKGTPIAGGPSDFRKGRAF